MGVPKNGRKNRARANIRRNRSAGGRERRAGMRFRNSDGGTRARITAVERAFRFQLRIHGTPGGGRRQRRPGRPAAVRRLRVRTVQPSVRLRAVGAVSVFPVPHRIRHAGAGPEHGPAAGRNGARIRAVVHRMVRTEGNAVG